MLTPATIAKLELGPDDVVVVRSNVNLSADMADQISKAVTHVLGTEHKVMVLAPNLSIEVVAKR